MAVVDVEIFECERYRLMSGWSKDYLLPTDSNVYRMRNCKKTWKVISEVDAAMLSPGWTWERLATSQEGHVGPEGWQVSPLPQADAEGWTYGVSFSPTYEGSPSGGVQYFARWRRLIRCQAFAGEAALQQAICGGAGPVSTLCGHVDLDAVSNLGQRLLDALATGSLYHSDASPTQTRLKWALAERILGEKASSSIDAALREFIDAQRGVGARVQEALGATQDEALAQSRRDLFCTAFPAEEREALAALALRRFRPELSCADESGAQHECRFRPVVCSHRGCGLRVSNHALESHEQSCRHLPLPCEKCGEQIPKGEHRMHLIAACPLRDAKCTYSGIGCEVPLTQQAVASHLDDCSQSHMLLLLCALQEQQDVIGKLTTRISELEARSAAHDKQSTESIDGHHKRVLALEERSKSMPAILDDKFSAAEKRAAEEKKRSVAATSEEAKKAAEKVGSKLEKNIEAVQKEVAGVQGQLRQVLGGPRPLEDRVQALEAFVARAGGGQ